MKTSHAIAKLYLRQLKLAYLITGIAFLANFITTVIYLFLPKVPDNGITSSGNLVALVVLLAAIFVPASYLRRTVNLGARRIDFFWGCIPVYAVLSAASALFVVLYHVLIDPLLGASGKFSTVLDVGEAFGFYTYGPVVAFIQCTVLLLLIAAFAHTLTMAQTAWYGWLADVILVAIISMFTPIPVLRSAEIWFFNLIIFGNVFAQVGSCLVLAAGLYALSMPILNRKKM